LPPPSSPASLRRIPQRAACPAFRGLACPQLAMDFQAAPTAVVATQLRRPSTPTALGFGLDMVQATSCEVGMAPPTPTNSSRRNSDAAVVMMPRSSRSMRMNVLHARNAEEVDAVVLPLEPELLQNRPLTPASASGPVSRRASFVGVAMLSSEVMQGSAQTWVTNGLSTPKNSDRRDIIGSVQQNIPLWRGSAVAAEAPRSPVTSPVTFMSSPPRPASRMGYVRPEVPMAPKSVFTCVQAVPVCAPADVAAPVLMLSPSRPATADTSERKWRPMPIEVDPASSWP